MGLFSRIWRGLRGARSTPATEAQPLAPTSDRATAPVNLDPEFLTTRDDRVAAERFVVMRQAVLDRDMAVIGYEFDRVGSMRATGDKFDRDRALLRHVCGNDVRKLVGERTAFVSVSHQLLFDPLIEELANTKTIALIRPAPPHRIGTIQFDRISALKQASVSVGLTDGREALENDSLASAVSTAFFSIADTLPPDLLRISRQLSRHYPALMLGVRGLETQEEFDACRRMHFVFYHGPFIRRREEWTQAQADPSAGRICGLLTSLRGDTALEDIAEQIKRDPMISYRLLRVANSAAVGATRSITSIRDAALIIGRERLYRWLVLLLCATGPASPGQQALLEHALARARLMELLAEAGASIPARQALFLTGMFSLLDVMLKVPMDCLLAQLTLPPEVKEAIGSRTGPCAPALQLAEACEQRDEKTILESCKNLGVTPDLLNQKLAAAGAWARESVREI